MGLGWVRLAALTTPRLPLSLFISLFSSKDDEEDVEADDDLTFGADVSQQSGVGWGRGCFFRVVLFSLFDSLVVTHQKHDRTQSFSSGRCGSQPRRR